MLCFEHRNIWVINLIFNLLKKTIYNIKYTLKDCSNFDLLFHSFAGTTVYLLNYLCAATLAYIP